MPKRSNILVNTNVVTTIKARLEAKFEKNEPKHLQSLERCIDFDRIFSLFEHRLENVLNMPNNFESRP